jgi:hypothetical protein
MASPIWQYDEFRGFALDFHDPREVDLYDARQGTDLDAENRIIRSLGISAEDIVIEYGAGTGAFLEAAAGICQRVHAVDVSRAMLEHARRRLSSLGVTNVTLHHAGFLTYEHRDDSARFRRTRARGVQRLFLDHGGNHSEGGICDSEVRISFSNHRDLFM